MSRRRPYRGEAQGSPVGEDDAVARRKHADPAERATTGDGRRRLYQRSGQPFRIDSAASQRGECAGAGAPDQRAVPVQRGVDRARGRRVCPDHYPARRLGAEHRVGAGPGRGHRVGYAVGEQPPETVVCRRARADHQDRVGPAGIPDTEVAVGPAADRPDHGVRPHQPGSGRHRGHPRAADAPAEPPHAQDSFLARQALRGPAADVRGRAAAGQP